MRICSSCKHTNEEGAKFCGNCGAPLENQAQTEAQQQTYTYTQTPPINGAPQVYDRPAGVRGMAIAGIVLNALAICNFCAGLPGLICAIIGLNQDKKAAAAWENGRHEESANAAKTAKVLAIIGLVLGLLSLFSGVITAILGGLSNFWWDYGYWY